MYVGLMTTLEESDIHTTDFLMLGVNQVSCRILLEGKVYDLQGTMRQLVVARDEQVAALCFQCALGRVREINIVSYHILMLYLALGKHLCKIPDRPNLSNCAARASGVR